jgi:predicted DNA-binding protein (MmcQ/YjbR family)
MTTIERLRKICMAMPGTTEKKIFDHPTFRVKDKMYCLYHGHAETPAIAFKVAKTEQGIFLEDPRFYKTPYIGQHGWVSMHEQGKLDWQEIQELVNGSYQLVAPRVSLKNAESKSSPGKRGRGAGTGPAPRAKSKNRE